MGLRHAVLGLLSIRPMTGYELKKAFGNSVNDCWSADQSQIYRTLSGLVDEGSATRRTVLVDDRPNRHPQRENRWTGTHGSRWPG